MLQDFLLLFKLLNDEKTRNELMDHLKSKGILAVFHYLSLHLSTIGRSMGYKEGQLPMTETMSGRLLRLPFYYDLKGEGQAGVVEGIKGFF